MENTGAELTDGDGAELTEGNGGPEHISRTPRPLTPNATRTGRAKGERPVERGEHMTGRVAQIFYGQGHGFIRAHDGRQLFFHRRDVPAAHFNALAAGDAVAFEVIEDKLAGPRAVNVKRAIGKRRIR